MLCTVLPFLFYTKGLSGIEAGKASILATIEMFVAAAAGVVFFNEKMPVTKTTGMLLVLAAIVLLNINFKKKNEMSCELLQWNYTNQVPSVKSDEQK